MKITKYVDLKNKEDVVDLISGILLLPLLYVFVCLFFCL
jgi:hypothetical protein